jgi:hypothetical protein
MEDGLDKDMRTKNPWREIAADGSNQQSWIDTPPEREDEEAVLDVQNAAIDLRVEQMGSRVENRRSAEAVFGHRALALGSPASAPGATFGTHE